MEEKNGINMEEKKNVEGQAMTEKGADMDEKNGQAQKPKISNKERVAALRTQTDAAITALFQNSRDYRRYLDTQSRFPGKSAGNVALISAARPDATHLATFEQWNEMNRSIRKGERGIHILEVATFTRETEELQADPATGEVLYDEQGQPLVEKRAEEISYYRVATVFDAKQTYGDGKVPVTDTVIRTEEGYRDFSAVLLPQGLKEGSEDTKQFAAAIALRAIEEVSKQHSREMYRPGTAALRAFQDQSAAYIVAAHYGVDTKDLRLSMEQLQDAAQGKSPEQLRDILEVSRKAALSVIGDIDRDMDALAQNRRREASDRTDVRRVYEVGDFAIDIRREKDGFPYDIYNKESGERVESDMLRVSPDTKMSKAVHTVVQTHEQLKTQRGSIRMSDVSRLDEIKARADSTRSVGGAPAAQKKQAEKPAVLKSLKNPLPPRQPHDTDAPGKKNTAPQR